MDDVVVSTPRMVLSFFDMQGSQLEGPLLFAIRVAAIIPRPVRLFLALPYV